MPGQCSKRLLFCACTATLAVQSQTDMRPGTCRQACWRRVLHQCCNASCTEDAQTTGRRGEHSLPFGHSMDALPGAISS